MRKISAIEAVLKRIQDEKIQRGLVHNANKKTEWINVPNIVAAARDDSFSKYLEMHNLERPDPPHCNDWTANHDCTYLRTHGYLQRRGYGTLLTYIGIAQLADYLDRVPDGDVRIRWQELGVTDARLLFKRLCRDIGIAPRGMGPFINILWRATVGQRSNLALFGGRKLTAPPPWTVNKEAFDAVLAEERQALYSAKARRRRRHDAPSDAAADLPPYGKRTPQKRAKRARKQQSSDEEQSSDSEGVYALSGLAVTNCKSPDN